MNTSSRLEYAGEDPQLFEPDEVELPARRVSKSEALVYVRSIRARLHRSDEYGLQEFGLEDGRVRHGHPQQRRVA